MHKKEVFLPSNTANLTKLSLKNFDLFTRGFQDSLLSEKFIHPKNYTPLYLYPSDDATELTSDFINKIKTPVNLIIPDGSWRQAAKLHKREPLLKNIQRVKINLQEKSQYKLRKQKYDYGLCTYEAIVHALSIIEKQTPKHDLLNNLKVMVDANLRARRQQFRITS